MGAPVRYLVSWGPESLLPFPVPVSYNLQSHPSSLGPMEVSHVGHAICYWYSINEITCISICLLLNLHAFYWRSSLALLICIFFQSLHCSQNLFKPYSSMWILCNVLIKNVLISFLSELWTSRFIIFYISLYFTTKYSSAYYIWILNGQSNSLYGSISTVKPVQPPHNHGSFVTLGNRVFHTPEIT